MKLKRLRIFFALFLWMMAGNMLTAYAQEPEQPPTDQHTFTVDKSKLEGICDSIAKYTTGGEQATYNAYFAAARVKQYPNKIFTGQRVVPLYIADICVGAELLGNQEPNCREYISFEDYLSLL